MLHTFRNKFAKLFISRKKHLIKVLFAAYKVEIILNVLRGCRRENMNLQNILNQFVWSSVFTHVTSGVAGGLILLLIQTILKKGVAHQFNKKMQEIKEKHDKALADIGHEYNKQLSEFNAAIAKESDKRQQDFQRKIHDFSLYSTKRHEIYPELFKKLHKLNSQLNNFESKAFLEMHMLQSKAELIIYLKEIGVDLNERFTNQIEKIYAEYDKHKNLQISFQQFNHVFRLHLTAELAKEYNVLNMFYSESLLYLSENVAIRIDKIIYGIAYLISPDMRTDFPRDVDVPALKQEITDKIDELKQLLKKELAVGDYSHLNQASN
ncbi:hypothetical protein QJ133_02240 [Priestia megaterium]|uniref:hypothetical protein n=1 Tax=Priestia megaterium TaxID=1404 RepID=UPI00249CAFE3|nr:hypothetical protein [Priestia megaterium]MDI3089996.1 hypothetical protein [Priestia megaterium]